MSTSLLQTFTITDIRALGPRFDPVTGRDADGRVCEKVCLSEDWTGTVRDIAAIQDWSTFDRMWIALRLVPAEIAPLVRFVWHTDIADTDFAWFNRLLDDEVYRQAVTIVERYTNGNQSEPDFREAQAAATYLKQR